MKKIVVLFFVLFAFSVFAVPCFAANEVLDDIVEPTIDSSVSSVSVAVDRSSPYYRAYDLMHEFVFGLDNELTNSQDLVCTLFATIVCVFMVSLPFTISLFFIRSICNF